MKTKMLLPICLLFAQTIVAQDVIVTAKAERIEAVITEVSPTELRYKKFSNPDGPTFVMYVKDVAAVIYKTGEVQVFEKPKAAAPEVAPKAATKATPAPETITVAQLPHISYKKVKVEGKKRPKYRYCTDDGRVMKESEFYDFLHENCPEAYAKCTQAHSWTIAACACMLIEPLGLIFSLIGLNKSGQVLPIYNRDCAGVQQKQPKTKRQQASTIEADYY